MQTYEILTGWHSAIEAYFEKNGYMKSEPLVCPEGQPYHKYTKGEWDTERGYRLMDAPTTDIANQKLQSYIDNYLYINNRVSTGAFKDPYPEKPIFVLDSNIDIRYYLEAAWICGEGMAMTALGRSASNNVLLFGNHFSPIWSKMVDGKTICNTFKRLLDERKMI